MLPGTNGTIRLFRFAGIQVFLHWSWFLVAVYQIEQRTRYSSISWSILEYLALFAIVTMHEFGHALACRKVGGSANQIILWPLGGVAYVSPPSRPGANLWSIAAGPLVNLALMPVLALLLFFFPAGSGATDTALFVRELNLINIVLFLFNVLPIYPLDGGKILRSLLWYVMGRARSLRATVVVGFIGVAGLGLLALFSESVWLGVVAVFAGMQCVQGYKLSQAMVKLEDAPRRTEVTCPACKASPARGAFWSCGVCKATFDTFEVNAKCPRCYTSFPTTTCPECGVRSAFEEWSVARMPEAGGTTSFGSTTPLASPSVIPVILGVIACVGALVLILVALVATRIASDEKARQPRYEAGVESLWQADGIAIPGKQTVRLQRGERYDAYIEDDATTSLDRKSVDIQILDADSGELLRTTRTTLKPFHRGNRILLPATTFTAPGKGPFNIQLSVNSAKATIARIKIGPSAGIASGNTAAVARGVSITLGVFAFILIAAAILLFLIYGRRRRELNLMLLQART